MVHVGALMPPGGLLRRQVSATVPVYAFEGVTVTVEVLPVVAPTVTVMLPLLVRAKVGVVEAGPATIAWIPSVWTKVPVAFLPVTSTLYVPLATEDAAEIVSMAFAWPPAASVADAGIEHVTPEAEQL